MASFYANENFPQPVVSALRQFGYDVLTVLETGKAAQSWPDEAVLEFASTSGRAVLTLNRKHFVRLHAEHPNHAGIVVCSFDPDFPGQASRIHLAVSPHATLARQLIRVNRDSR